MQLSNQYIKSNTRWYLLIIIGMIVLLAVLTIVVAKIRAVVIVRKPKNTKLSNLTLT